MKKTLVMHVNSEYAADIVKAMRKAGYKLHLIDHVNSWIHLEFKRK